jgi:hypothetical protein
MSFPGSGDFDVKNGDRFKGSPAGFLSPGSLSYMDVRRDSVTSSQSYMSSFGPVTRTHGHSPPTEDNYVEVVYGFDHEPHFDGLPISQQPKLVGQEDNLFNSWHFVPHSSDEIEPFSSAFTSQSMMTTAGEMFYAPTSEQPGFEVDMVSTLETPWINIPSTIHPDLGHPWGSDVHNPAVSEHQFQTLWSDPMQAAGSSVAMTDVVGNYDQSEPDSFARSDMFENASFPQSPQEVNFKREQTPVVKQESHVKGFATRARRRIYENATGGKAVKNSKRRQPKIACKPKDIEMKWDEYSNAYQYYSKKASQPRQFCDHPGCNKAFGKPEHLKRHMKTHTNIKEYHCFVPDCPRQFPRNDNFREHVWSHVYRPGKKGRNSPHQLVQVEAFSRKLLDNTKMVEFLRRKMGEALQKAGMSEMGMPDAIS